MSNTLKYNFDDILKYRPADVHLPVNGLMYIVVTAPAASTTHRSRSNTQGDQTKRQQQSKNNNRGGKWNRNDETGTAKAPLLQESSTSFSAARRKPEQDQTTKVISEVRVILNKVTDENMNILLKETRDVCCPKIQDLMKSFETTEERESFLMQLAKLFVQKAQIDHAFSKWYAQLASELVLSEFGDILYEVCREALPQYRYDPDEKRKYLGALLLLVELRRYKMVSLMNLEAAADRIFCAVARNLGTVVMATTTEAPIDPVVQIEVCLELLCKYLVVFFQLERPAPAIVEKYLTSLRDLSNNKDRVKPRSRFLLVDFFKQM